MIFNPHSPLQTALSCINDSPSVDSCPRQGPTRDTQKDSIFCQHYGFEDNLMWHFNTLNGKQAFLVLQETAAYFGFFCWSGCHNQESDGTRSLSVWGQRNWARLQSWVFAQVGPQIYFKVLVLVNLVSLWEFCWAVRGQPCIDHRLN